MNFILITILFVCITTVVAQAKSSIFDSSPSNRERAKQEYKDSPAERVVATVFGDELPKMRDDLIKRKNEGQGFVKRHVEAWKNDDNWTVDKENQDRQIKADRDKAEKAIKTKEAKEKVRVRSRQPAVKRK